MTSGMASCRAGVLTISRRGRRQRGFSLFELLVSAAIATVLVSLLLPALSRMNREGERIRCLNHLRIIGHAMLSYSTSNSGVVPRSFTIPYPHDPNWGRIVEAFVHGRSDPDRALWDVHVLRCPSHPVQGIDTGFLINGMVAWDDPGSLYSRFRVMSLLSRVKRPSDTLYFMDASNYFGIRVSEDWPGEREGVHFIGFHNIARVHQLPQGPMARVPVSRHGQGRINALYFDFHAATVDFSEVNLRSLDDGDLSDWFTRIPEVLPPSQ